MLCAVTTDLGQCAENTPPRAHTARLSLPCLPSTHAQFLIFTSPFARHFSQFQAAGEEN